MKRAAVVFALGSVGLAPLAGCRGKAAPDEILLGEYVSLTGTTATFGVSTDQGVRMALDEINAKGGIGGRLLRLRVEDDQSRPEEAATAATKLINQDRVVAVLGEISSGRSLAAAPICQAARVPMVSPSSTHPSVTQVGDYIFRVCFTDPFQGGVGARIARDIMKAQKAAILYDVRNEYSVGLKTVFVERFQAAGGRVVGEQSYGEGDSDFRAQLTQLKAAAPDVLYVPGYYTEVGLIARQARDLGFAAPLLGGDGWDSPKLTEIAAGALTGSYFSNHYAPDLPDPRVQAFVAEYRKRYGVVPDGLAALGYDAARVLGLAIERAGSTEGPRIRDALAAIKAFPGVTGEITIDGERNARKPAVVLRIEGDAYRYVTTIQP
jgi:branched-chain amino acid transport system substrate-binding protein